MYLDGFGLFVDDMPTMVRFYRDVLGFEIREDENTSNVYLIKDGTLFMLYRKSDFETMTSRKYQYIKGQAPAFFCGCAVGIGSNDADG